MTATSQPYSKVYDECYNALSTALRKDGIETQGSAIEKAFRDLDKILGPKQGLAVDRKALTTLTSALKEGIRQREVSHELYQRVIVQFSGIATCDGLTLENTHHISSVAGLARNAYVEDVATEGGHQLHPSRWEEFGLRAAPKPDTKKQQILDTKPETGQTPEALLKELETASGAVHARKRKAIEFFTHDAEGIFSAGRTAISAAVVAALAFTTVAILRTQKAKGEKAANTEAARS